MFQNPYEPIPGSKYEKQKSSLVNACRVAAAMGALLLLFFVSHVFCSTMDSSLTPDILITIDPNFKRITYPVPEAKQIVKNMDSYISNHVEWNNFEKWTKIMETFFMPHFEYITIPYLNLGVFTGIEKWYYGEHIPFNYAFPDTAFNQMIFVGSEKFASTTTYAQATWMNDLGNLKASGKQVLIRICDFYMINTKEKKIQTNWMQIDTVDLMRQAGYQVLAKPNVEEGWIEPPRALDGLPAPNSFTQNSDTEALYLDKIRKMIDEEWIQQKDNADHWVDDMHYYGCAGIGYMSNKNTYISEFLQRMHSAFTPIRIDEHMALCEQNYCAISGNFIVQQTGSWIGEPASGQKERSLWFGQHFRINPENSAIAEGWLMLDLPNYFAQVGTHLEQRMTHEYKIN